MLLTLYLMLNSKRSCFISIQDMELLYSRVYEDTRFRPQSALKQTHLAHYTKSSDQRSMVDQNLLSTETVTFSIVLLKAFGV